MWYLHAWPSVLNRPADFETGEILSCQHDTEFSAVLYCRVCQLVIRNSVVSDSSVHFPTSWPGPGSQTITSLERAPRNQATNAVVRLIRVLLPLQLQLQLHHFYYLNKSAKKSTLCVSLVCGNSGELLRNNLSSTSHETRSEKSLDHDNLRSCHLVVDSHLGGCPW